MRILVFHGYLLGGTGSNVYNASLASALARLGHEVHLLCQDRRAGELAWVDAVGDWDQGALRVRPAGDGGRTGRGGVTVYTPDIGGLLPVYVRDRYEGFAVKEFPELSDAELERYVELNAAAIRDVAERAGGIDAALGNHLVMGPVALARAGLRYALKVHGSDLSYTILPNLDRFLPYVREAVASANGILVGSAHIAERLRQAIDEPEVNAKVRLGPPGVDTELIAPLPPAEHRPRLSELADELATHSAEAGEGSWARDPAEAACALEWLAEAPGPRVVFVGKLIVSKGVDLLLAAWPLVAARAPGARLIVVGFGAFREALERLWEALTAGDLEAAREIAAQGRRAEGGSAGELPILASFLADPPAGYAEACRGAAGSVAFAGRLEHGEVARLLPACDALAFPSTFPEAFGMVAAEAAAAGALPVSAAHSGALEVSRALGAGLPPETAGLVSFPLDGSAVEALAERLGAWLAMDEADRAATRRALRDTVVRLWSWDRVAETMLAAAAGELDGLDPAS